MEILIKGEPKEIADLVNVLQNQKAKEDEVEIREENWDGIFLKANV